MSMLAPITRPSTSSQAALAASLRRQIASRFKLHEPVGEANSSGLDQLDRILPRGGIQRGTLVDWLFAQPGNGTGSLALRAAQRALGHDTSLVVIDPQRQFYPPGAAALGVDLEAVVWIRPAAGRDALWAWEQSLRSSAVAAVWGPLEQIEPRAFRRLQLAAEAGRAVGHLIRPARLRSQPSWAPLQLLVETAAEARCRITVTRSAHGGAGESIELEPLAMGARHASFPFPLAAAMADSTLGPRAVGA